MGGVAGEEAQHQGCRGHIVYFDPDAVEVHK
jgi:hypothetical protein